MEQFNPPHPGLVLREFMDKRSITECAERIKVNRVTLSRILNGAAAITPDMALRISAVFGTSVELWTGMQTKYDLWQAKKKVPKLRAFPRVAQSEVRAHA